MFVGTLAKALSISGYAAMACVCLLAIFGQAPFFTVDFGLALLAVEFLAPPISLLYRFSLFGYLAAKTKNAKIKSIITIAVLPLVVGAGWILMLYSKPAAALAGYWLFTTVAIRAFNITVSPLSNEKAHKNDIPSEFWDLMVFGFTFLVFGLGTILVVGQIHRPDGIVEQYPITYAIWGLSFYSLMALLAAGVRIFPSNKRS